MRNFKATELGDAVLTRAKTLSWTPSLKIVSRDDFWNRPARLSFLEARLPALLLSLDLGDGDIPAEVAPDWSASLQWRLTVLRKLDAGGNTRDDLAGWLDDLVDLFIQGRYQLDEFSEVGNQVLACYVSGFGNFDDLIERGIGGVTVQLTTDLVVRDQ